MYIEVNVIPGARKEAVTQRDTTRYDIAVREPASRNLANTRVREIVAEIFSVAVADAQIVAGHRSPKKIIRLEK
jgi:uncharacterized protein YggU (UPF0235/DUF167 family)